MRETDEDLGKLDEALNFFIAKMNLIYEKCHLNHGIGIEPPDATNYLCQKIGDLSAPIYDSIDPALLAIPELSNGVDDIEDVLRIPICEECAAGLYDEDWLLFYCLKCNSSQWLIKSKAKKLYPHWESIRFLAGCPICTIKDDE